MTIKKVEKSKVQVYLTTEMKEYLYSQANVFGMTVSSFVAMIVSQYKQGVNVVDMMSDFKDSVNELKNIKKKEN